MLNVGKQQGVLEALGLSAPEEMVYRVLLGHGPMSAKHISAQTNFNRSEAVAILASLEHKGLVSQTPGAQPRFVAAPPRPGLEALVVQRAEELKRVEVEVGRLAAAFAARPDLDRARPPVELVHGGDATRQRWVQVQRTARTEVRILERPPYVIPTTTPNQEELELLGRGIKYRVLYDQTSFDAPGKMASALACISAGEEAKVMSGVPMKLIVGDNEIALTHDPQDEIQSGLVVHPSPLMDALLLLFEVLWDSATPFRSELTPSAAADMGDALDATDLRILSLLAVGAKDEAIAHRLGLGVRTVRRRIAILMEDWNAGTRFQAGIEAGKRGLV